jgi:hypothetical protein
MPTELFFSGGASVKVLADVQSIRDALDEGEDVLDSQRFAGFRGDEAVGGGRVLVSLGSLAYAMAIAAP